MLTNFLRKMAYKIRRKIEPKTVVISGVRLTAEPGDVPPEIRKQLYQKSYEKGEHALVEKALKPEDRVLEVGTGIGFISLSCAKICGPGNVLSYEPNPAMKRVIEKNYALNDLHPTLRNKVLSVQSGEVEFFVSENVLSSSLIDRKHGGAARIQADAIADVVKDYDPTAIVMDVEGAEVELLRSCDLEGVNKMILEVHPHIVGKDAIEDLLNYLEEQGFRILSTASKRVLLHR